MADSLQFWVGLSSTLAPQGRLMKISSANINLQLNNAGSVSLTVDRSEIFASSAATPLTNCILVYRSGALVWSGPIWTIDEQYSGEQRKVSINAIGWFELLNHRLIRTQPGYSLTTSGIAITNPGFESAISGWSSNNSTPTRSTAVFDAGTASLLITENVTGPFGSVLSPSIISYSGNTTAVFGSAPTSGKRYKLNFRMRARKNSGFVGGDTPYAEILESGARVGYVDLNQGSSQVSYDTFWTPTAGPSYNAQTYESVDTTNFRSYSIEWVSNGSTPELRFSWKVNPTQLLNGDGTSVAYWQTQTALGNTISSDSNGNIVCLTAAGGGYTILCLTSAFNGILDSAKTYKVIINYYWTTTPTVSGSLSVLTATGGTAATLDLSTGVPSQTYTSKSVTWSASGTQPYTFYISGTWNVAQAQGIVIQDITVQENSTDTDPLMNVDAITLQEYTGDGIYSATDAGQIATALLQKTNSDNNSKITPGTVQTTQPRTRTYQQFSNVGKEIKALSDIESGFDFAIDPVTRAMNIYNRTNATNFPSAAAGSQAGVGTWVYSADRSSALRFEYGIGSDNLASIRKTQDSSTVVNRLNVKGKYALGQASDATSQSSYGLFEELISLPDVIDASTSILPFYANAEVAFRKNPKIIYEIQTKTRGNTPRLFIDFNIGDRATINVGPNILASGSALTQQIRIFGVQMSVDAEGNEKLSGLQLSA